jgi:hypothetical protein
MVNLCGILFFSVAIGIWQEARWLAWSHAWVALWNLPACAYFAPAGARIIGLLSHTDKTSRGKMDAVAAQRLAVVRTRLLVSLAAIAVLGSAGEALLLHEFWIHFRSTEPLHAVDSLEMRLLRWDVNALMVLALWLAVHASTLGSSNGFRASTVAPCTGATNGVRTGQACPHFSSIEQRGLPIPSSPRPPSRQYEREQAPESRSEARLSAGARRGPTVVSLPSIDAEPLSLLPPTDSGAPLARQSV